MKNIKSINELFDDGEQMYHNPLETGKNIIKDFKKQESIINDIRTMYAFTQDEKFMKTVGNKSKNVLAAQDYLYIVRPGLVQDKKNKTKSTKELDQTKLQFIETYSNGDPELKKFLEIFFSRDDYTEIDITDVWTKVNE